MGSLLSLYFLHPITTRLANKTQRFNPRYDLTNPTKNPSSPFAFSLLSTFLLHLHYTLQSPSPSVTTLCSFVTLSLIPLLLSPVLMLLCLLIPCYYPRSFVTLSPHPLLLPFVLMLPCLLLPCLSSPHPLLLSLCFFVTLSPFTLSPYILSCKECLPVLSTGAFTLSKTRPFKHAEHAFLAP